MCECADAIIRWARVVFSLRDTYDTYVSEGPKSSIHSHDPVIMIIICQDAARVALFDKGHSLPTFKHDRRVVGVGVSIGIGVSIVGVRVVR